MLYMAKKPLPLRIDEDLLRRVDEARGDVSRTRWVVRALEHALGDAASDAGAVGRARSRASAEAPEHRVVPTAVNSEEVAEEVRRKHGTSCVSVPEPVPGVRRGRDVSDAMVRQRRLNEARAKKAAKS